MRYSFMIENQQLSNTAAGAPSQILCGPEAQPRLSTKAARPLARSQSYQSSAGGPSRRLGCERALSRPRIRLAFQMKGLWDIHVIEA
jgi:hypothetical protein